MGGIFTCGIWDVFACSSTATRAIDKRRPQRDSAHQIGPEIPIHRILMVVVSCCTWGEDVWAEFFALRLWRCSGQPCNNQQSYGQMDVKRTPPTPHAATPRIQVSNSLYFTVTLYFTCTVTHASRYSRSRLYVLLSRRTFSYIVF